MHLLSAYKLSAASRHYDAKAFSNNLRTLDQILHSKRIGRGGDIKVFRFTAQ